MHLLFEVITTLATGLFVGAAIYINLVEHPARIEGGTAAAVRGFGASYRRGARLMGSLIMLGGFSAMAVWLTGSSAWWLAGASLLLMLIPYTLLLVLPINNRLLSPDLEKDSERVAKLLVRWGRLHTVRSLLGLMSFLIFIILLVRGASK